GNARTRLPGRPGEIARQATPATASRTGVRPGRFRFVRTIRIQRQVCTAGAGHVWIACRAINREARAAAVVSTAVARRRVEALPLGGGLLKDVVQGVQLRSHDVRLAEPPAG